MSDPAPSPSYQDVPWRVAWRRALTRSRPGYLTLALALVWFILTAARLLFDLPAVIDTVARLAGVGALLGTAGLGVVTATADRRGFLWFVRRKLILSYVFLGVVPVVLVLVFALATGVLLYITVASYVFQQGYEAELGELRRLTEVSAIEVGRASSNAPAVLARRIEDLSTVYPRLSIALVPTQRVPAGSRTAPTPIVAGPWDHTAVPARLPEWLDTTFSGTLLAESRTATGSTLVLRAVALTVDRRRALVADLPIDRAVFERLTRRTGATADPPTAARCDGPTPASDDARSSSRSGLFREAIAYVDCTDWESGSHGRLALGLRVPVGDLYSRLSAANADELGWTVLVQLLVVLAVLFLIIQGSALVIGGLLARSITSAVHELFEGTERVQRGDFAHRIDIESRDQLGALAASFNRMSASVEHLLHVQREKQRLDDELRIAREIQRSLLPKRPTEMPGLDIADLCEPAREVGGDYYDFFVVGPRKLAVLIADVAGKGTSAALYMAELKGLMLALSQSAPSPRQLVIEVNRRLSNQLRPQSFVTMTYAVIDLDHRTVTVARAGHTPLLIVRQGQVTSAAPDGVVLGLQLPGAEATFEEVTAEYCQDIADGDLLVFYTDGVTEAVNPEGELYGDERLAQVVASQQALTAAGIRERVLRDVRAHVGDADAHDDMTMVLVKVSDRHG